MVEEWVEIPGWDGKYLACRDGRIRSRHCAPNECMKPFTNKHNYSMLTFYADGKSKSMFVHQAIALAFLGPRPPWDDCSSFEREPSGLPSR